MSDSRTFFVSDGYCNQRIIKYVIRSINEKGYHSVVKVSEFGANNIPFQPNVDKRVYNFKIPHALALFENKQLICVADRENRYVVTAKLVYICKTIFFFTSKGRVESYKSELTFTVYVGKGRKSTYKWIFFGAIDLLFLIS